MTFNRLILQFNPYHLVQQSPWPILVSFSLLSYTQSAVMYMHGYNYGGFFLTLGFSITTIGMILWFRDIIKEASYEGAHTKQVQNGIMIGFILFIVSEAFAFLSVFWAFFHSALSPAIEIGGCWPPQGITVLNPFAIPLLNTILLLSSGAFITYAHHALLAGDRKGGIEGTLVTILLAVLFTALQYYEYVEAPFTITDSVFGSAFFASTGLHGLHVIVVTTFILVGFFRMINYHFSSTHHLGFEAAILYWHFVDVVWLFLFIAVYYWGSN